MAENIAPKKSPPTLLLATKQPLPLLAMGTDKLKDQPTLTSLLRKGLSLGCCHHIDTARYYNNELPLGKAIKTVIQENRCTRTELFIATKCMNYVGEDPVLQVKEVLRLMQLEYVDLYYLHWPVVDMEPKGEGFLHRGLGEVWARMEECVRKGYTRYLGVSNFNGQALNELLAICKIKPIALQIQLHPYLPQTALVETAQRLGLQVFAYSPLARCGAFNDEYNIMKQDLILDLASKYGRTPAQIVLKSTLQRNIGVIPKTSNQDRLKQNCQCWGFDLTEEDMKKIKAMTKRVRICPSKTKFFSVFDY